MKAGTFQQEMWFNEASQLNNEPGNYQDQFHNQFWSIIY